jgi:predicted translin family RNA/ssDNA-binding protein
LYKYQFLRVTEEDYLLGVADLTGELMRLAINSIGMGNSAQALDVCHFLRNVKTSYELINFPPARKKVNEMRNSLLKVEEGERYKFITRYVT